MHKDAKVDKVELEKLKFSNNKSGVCTLRLREFRGLAHESEISLGQVWSLLILYECQIPEISSVNPINID